MIASKLIHPANSQFRDGFNSAGINESHERSLNACIIRVNFSSDVTNKCPPLALCRGLDGFYACPTLYAGDMCKDR